MSDPIAEAIQKVLDVYGDEWQLSQYIVGMGLERIDDDGKLEITKWYYAPPGQHQDFTDALVRYLARETDDE